MQHEQTVILVVSFGTGCCGGCQSAIGAIAETIADKLSGYEVRAAILGQRITEKPKKHNGIVVEYVKEALDRAAADKVTALVVQPACLVAGYGYRKLADMLKSYGNHFEQTALGKPLLADGTDIMAMIRAIMQKTAAYDDGNTAVCLIGHGTGACANHMYVKMQEKLIQMGYENYYIGTVRAEPSLKDVQKLLKDHSGYRRVVLHPMLVAAGFHVNCDMAGHEDWSWKSVLEKEGYEVVCIMEGLAQIPAVRDICAAHAKAALNTIGRQTGLPCGMDGSVMKTE